MDKKIETFLDWWEYVKKYTTLDVTDAEVIKVLRMAWNAAEQAQKEKDAKIAYASEGAKVAAIEIRNQDETYIL